MNLLEDRWPFHYYYDYYYYYHHMCAEFKKMPTTSLKQSIARWSAFLVIILMIAQMSFFYIIIDRTSLMRDELTQLGRSTWRKASTSSVSLSLASTSFDPSPATSSSTPSILMTRSCCFLHSVCKNVRRDKCSEVVRFSLVPYVTSCVFFNNYD